MHFLLGTHNDYTLQRPLTTMSEKIKRLTIPDLPKGGPYSHATVHGDTIYLSGVVGVAKGEDKTFSEQWKLIAERAQKILENLGSDLGTRTVKLTAYLSDSKYFEKLNKAFGETFGDEAPSRTTIVCDFTLKEVKVELDIIASA